MTTITTTTASLKLKLTRLDLSWSISRGRDTEGYNICRLDDANTGKRYKCIGGGYDMVGTVFGDYLNDVYQDRLVKLFQGRADIAEAGYQVPGYNKIEGLYGITLNPGSVAHCDGGCGISSMIQIAEAIGLEVQTTWNRKSRNGATTGFIVSEPEFA